MAGLGSHVLVVPQRPACPHGIASPLGVRPRSYLQGLHNYLADFHKRTQPLFQLEKQLAKVRLTCAELQSADSRQPLSVFLALRSRHVQLHLSPSWVCLRAAALVGAAGGGGDGSSL